MTKRTTMIGALGGILLAGLLLGRSCLHGDSRTVLSEARGATGGAARAGLARLVTAVEATASASPDRASGQDAGEGRVVFFSSWGGSGLDQVGRERPTEGNPVGPMSLARDNRGRIYVLDQQNRRVVRHAPDGRPEASSPVNLGAAEDLAFARDGSMVVLDRLVDKSIALYDGEGRPRGQLGLVGEGIDEPGFVTGVFVDGRDVYVEREHGPLVKVGDTTGAPAEPRTEVPGRPSQDGQSYLNAGIIDAAAGRVYVAAVDRASGAHRFTRELRMKGEVHGIVLLDSDKAGTIYFAVELHQEPATHWIVLQCLEPLRGTPVGGAILPANTMPEETFRDLTALEDGGVLLALRSLSGVSYQRYGCDG